MSETTKIRRIGAGHVPFWATLACTLLGFIAPANAAEQTVNYAKSAITADIGSNGLKISVAYDGAPIITPSKAGLGLGSMTLGQGNITVLGVETTTQGQEFDLVVGKTKHVSETYRQSIFHLRQKQGEANFDYDLILRAYAGGVAYRFYLPPAFKGQEVMSDLGRFDFAADYDCWGLNLGRFVTSHEGEFDKIKASSIRNFNLYDSPLVCKTGQGEATFALYEADVHHYPTSYFNGRGDGGIGVEITLTPRADNISGARQSTVAAKIDSADGLFTPWRVVALGDRPTDLVSSNLISALAAPSRLKDTSWIKPGMVAWDWWNGNQAGANPGINTETYFAFADFAAENGFSYIMLDEGWSIGSSTEPNPKADVTRYRDYVDVSAIVAHAKAKKVGVWLWVQWEQLDRQMDAALAQYEAWGIKGIKVDFMNRGDQDMVDFYHRLLEKAAQHHIMVNLHGAYAPNGLAITYPNYMTQEGVLGAENNKWSARITARHNVTLAYTRMILGPMDYTPGGFNHVTPADFPSRQQFIKPVVMTTRGQALAMYVVYDSPLQMISDYPDAYKDQSGFEFLKTVPTTWDETRVLAGDIGDYIVTARRSGSTWYIGAMTNEEGRGITIPLSFLGDGAYAATVWQDGETVSSVKATQSSVTQAQTLNLRLAPNGGGVAILSAAKPAKKKHK